jgi:hypothetical protein
MTKKWIVINLMLLVAAGLLGWQLYASVKRYKEENNVGRLARLQAPKKKTGAESGLAAVRSDQKINSAEFTVIPAQNLFSDTRRMEDKTDNVPAPEPARKLDVIPVLVGIMISGAQRTALINDPAAGNPSGANRHQTMRLGDHYRGFVVTDITNNSMILEWGSSREVIPLYDTSKPPTPSGKTVVAAARTVNFGGATAGGGVANAMVVQPGRMAPGTTVTPAAQSARPQPGVAQRPIGAGQGPNAAQPVSGSAAAGFTPGPTWNSVVDRQGNIIVNSPMGAFTLPPSQTTTAPPVKK